MRTLGIIGGMSWESTALYYRLINEAVRARLGGLSSGQLLVHSCNFAEIEPLQTQGRWREAGEMLASTAAALELAGADAILVASNTMHKVADQITERVSIPFLDIVDAAAHRLRASGKRRVGLLGTRFTMEDPFNRDRLATNVIDTLAPSKANIAVINEIIYRELCQGRVRAESRATFRRVIAEPADQGADSIILGCTEITMLVGPEDASLPVFDTTAIHVETAVEFLVAQT
jgi:aspartate racemase